jgi:hypothetical protein
MHLYRGAPLLPALCFGALLFTLSHVFRVSFVCSLTLVHVFRGSL